MECSNEYAEALFTLAKDHDLVEKIHDEFSSLVTLFKEEPSFHELLKCEFLHLDERKKVIDQTLATFDPFLINFLKVLLDQHRLNNLEEIYEIFNQLYQDNQGILEGTILSVKALKEQEIEKIEDAFYQKKKMKVKLKNIVDSSLIGGIRVVIQDQIYDGSIKTKLDRLKASLKKEGA